MADSFKQFVTKHGLVAFGLLVWLLILITAVTYQIFFGLTVVTTQVASCYATLLGIPSIIIPFVQSRLNKSNGEANETVDR